MTIGSINSYAAFPTFVWTGEYRSRIYAVEIAADEIATLGDVSAVNDAMASGDEEIIVFDTVEDGPNTPTDMEEKQPTTDEGMNNAGDEEIEKEFDSVAQFITSYDIEPAAGEDDTEPVEEQQEENTEPEQEG